MYADRDQLKKRRDSVAGSFRQHPSRLINALGLQMDRRGQGLVCPYCGNGSGADGTGVNIDPHNSAPHFKCFKCGEYFDVFNLVEHVKGLKFMGALEFLERLYADETSTADLPAIDAVFNGQPACPYSYTGGSSLMPGGGEPLVNSVMLKRSYTLSLRYAHECVSWREQCADELGLPAYALEREDIGKSYLALPSYSDTPEGNNGMDEHCGDMVFYVLDDDRRLVAAKTRHMPGISAEDYTTWLNPKSGMFEQKNITNPDAEREFRSSGQVTRLCFGRTYISDDISTVVIVEGQTDVLAVCAAMVEAERLDVTAIGRDNKNHVLVDEDLKLLANRNVVYVDDYDAIGSPSSRRNLDKLAYCGANSVTEWTPPSPTVKDSRSFYIKYGGNALAKAILPPSECHS